MSFIPALSELGPTLARARAAAARPSTARPSTARPSTARPATKKRSIVYLWQLSLCCLLGTLPSLAAEPYQAVPLSPSLVEDKEGEPEEPCPRPETPSDPEELPTWIMTVIESGAGPLGNCLTPQEQDTPRR